jgi:cytochrome c-type biogenesis protein CcmE
MKKGWKIALTVAVVAGGITFLAYNSLGDVEYYQHVHQVLGEPARWETKNLQVHGYVVPGSIHEEIVGQKSHRSFEIEYCGKSLPVRHAGSKPDTFKEQAEAVVKGKLVHADGKLLLQAVEGENGILAKCPSKYEGNREAPKCDGT